MDHAQTRHQIEQSEWVSWIDDDLRWWPPGRTARLWVVGLTLAAAVLGSDLFVDWRAGVHPMHLVMHLVSFLVLGLTAFSIIRSQRRRTVRLRRRLGRLQTEAHQWKESSQQLLRGLGEQIDQQFLRWQLSNAEKKWHFFCSKA
ncbi:MAG: hypothetical protein IPJ88_15075 [Myxococcales bacterium]|nr:MAG: hypothetical protein IPJ88_15075 [Myxococcales bacterium]